MTDPSAIQVLLVDDDRTMLEVLRLRLERWGYRTRTASDGREAREALARTPPDVVISDVVMPGVGGIELLETLKQDDADRPVILITSHGTVDLAVEAMKVGADEFLTKPLDWEQLRSTLEEAALHVESRRASRRLEEDLGDEPPAGGRLLGGSAAIAEVCELIAELAPTDAPVLITGESGTGKELAARILHQRSGRAQQPFVALNAAALPAELVESELFGHEKGAFTGATGTRAGCFERAHRGTLFLDEISEMPVALQPKLLRVLEDGRVRRLGGKREHRFDVRLLAATNRDPQTAIEEGRLRQDLYYRLSVFGVELPPLRERTGDVPLLAHHFLRRFAAKHGAVVERFDDEAMRLLAAYPWPGNVRELRNVVERTVVLAKSRWIGAGDLPAYLRRPPPRAAAAPDPLAGATLAEVEKRLILKTLEETGNNKTETARRLGVAPRTIYNKLKSYESESE